MLNLYQVCQTANTDGYPAGSKNTSFDVDSVGNVVISYGAITGPDDHTRYLTSVH